MPNTPLDIPHRSTLIGGGNDVSPHATATVSGLAGDAAVHRYFELSSVIERAKADGNFVRAVCAARETYPLMPAVVRQMKSSSVASISALRTPFTPQVLSWP
jgi:cobalamin biosynthesis Co2+ chelatase CbiK